MSLQQHERKYLIAKVTAIDAAIESLRSSPHSPREQAALELLVATRTKMLDALGHHGQEAESTSD